MPGHRSCRKGRYYFGMLFGALGVALFIVWVFCVFDVIASDETLVRNLPKFYWLLIVILVPSVGAVAWLVLGRPQGVALTPGSNQYRASRTPLGPEDSPGFISRLEEKKRLERWEEDLRRREDELRREPGEAD